MEYFQVTGEFVTNSRNYQYVIQFDTFRLYLKQIETQEYQIFSSTWVLKTR